MSTSSILNYMLMTSKLSAFLTNRAAVRAALFNSLWLLLDKGLRLVGGVFVGLWVARYLAPENFGVFNSWAAFYGLVFTFLTLGFDQVLLRYLVKYPSREQLLIGTVVGLRFIVSSIIIVLFLCVFFMFSSKFDFWITVGLLVGVFFSPFLTLRQWFESRVLSKYVVMAELSAFVVASVLKIAGVLYAFSVSWFVFVVILESIMGIVGYAVVYHKQRNSRRWQFDWKIARLLLSQSWPIFMSCLAIFVYTKIDQLMVLYLAGSYAAGIYAAAARVSEILYFLPAIIVSSVFPALTILRKSDMSKYTRQLGYLFSWGSLAAYIVSFFIFFLAPVIVNLLYGVAYSDAVPVLLVHVFSFVWIVLGILSSIFVVNEKIMKHVLIRDYCAVALNVGLNFCLIPYYGALGAAIATLVAYSFVSVWGNFFFPKLRPLFYLQLRGLMLEGLGRGFLKLKAKL